MATPLPTRSGRASSDSRTGTSLVEIVFVLGLVATLASLAVPMTRASVDEARAASAAWYVAAQFRLARMVAVTGQSAVGFRFEAEGDGYRFTRYRDGSGNGIRLADIRRGIDVPTAPPDRLPERAPGVEFGIAGSIRGVDGGAPLRRGADPLRIGRADIVTFTPLGTATSGTLYIRGRGSRQYAVRILGATGRIRTLEYRFASSTWLER